VVSLNLKTMEKLSKHVSYKEGVYSRTAERLGLKNDPSDAHLANMKLIAEKVFEPLREHVGGPIKINSFYRGPELNAAIGGSAKSQHCHGQAIDIDDTFGHATNAEMFYWIQQNLDFDQMIWEFGTDENPNWVHVSYVSPEENRKRCLKAYKDNGKTKYMVI
jgi:zinc D-Ala-D-Ala carboxypeptidase